MILFNRLTYLDYFNLLKVCTIEINATRGGNQGGIVTADSGIDIAHSDRSHGLVSPVTIVSAGQYEDNQNISDNCYKWTVYILSW